MACEVHNFDHDLARFSQRRRWNSYKVLEVVNYGEIICFPRYISMPSKLQKHQGTCKRLGNVRGNGDHLNLVQKVIKRVSNHNGT